MKVREILALEVVPTSERNAAVSANNPMEIGRLPLNVDLTLGENIYFAPAVRGGEKYQAVAMLNGDDSQLLGLNTFFGIAYRDGKRTRVVEQPFTESLEKMMAAKTTLQCVRYETASVDRFGSTTEKVAKSYPVFVIKGKSEAPAKKGKKENGAN